MSFSGRVLKFAALLTLLLLSSAARAVVAKPGPVSVRQPDGTVKTVTLHGDEFFHYMTDAAGNVVRQDAAGYIKPFLITAAGLEDAALRREKTFSEIQPLLSGKIKSQTKAGTAYRHKGLVLLVNFKDNSFSVKNPQKAFSDMLNKEGYNGNGGTGSVRDYYIDNSCWRFVPDFDVYGPYTLPQKMEYYGGNNGEGADQDPWQMAIDALDAAYKAGVSLSDYDNDKDGVIDYVFIYYAGYAESSGAEAKTVWPHASTLYYHDVEKGGVRYGDYACASELSGVSGTDMANIGTFCHEFGHVLGLTDLYDTDYEESGGKSMALGDLSLMSGGCYNNESRTPPCLIAEERSTLGWLELKTLTAGTLSLPPIADNVAYCLSTDNVNEYFLFEVRKREGWDKYIPGDGLLVYHVDKSRNIVWKGATAAGLWLSNAPNACPRHECMKVVLADNSSLAGAFYPGASNRYTSFTPYTKPSARAWSGMPLAFQLTDIALAPDGSVTFTSSRAETKSELMGKVTDFYGEPIGKANLTLIPQSGGSSLTASTDGVGSFLFGQPLAAGEYILCCEASGYEAEKMAFTMGESPIALDFMLLKEGESKWNISWASGELYNAIGADEAFSIAALWEPGDIGLLKKTSLVSASVYVYEGKPEITARVYVDGLLSGEKKISSSSVKENSNNVVDFSDLKIEYQNTQSLQIVFLFSKFSGFCYLGTDGGPAHAGNGDLFGNAVGGELTSLYESEDYNSNWLLYITLEGDCIQSLEDGLVSLSGQRSMYLEWNPIGDVWSCSCVGEGQTFSVDTLTRPSVLLENLTPGKTYEITLEGFSADGTKVSAYTFTHSMTFIQDKPMYISYLASSFKKEGRMLLEVYNLPDKAKVTWTVDGKEYKEPLLYGKGSSQIVEAHISLPSGGGTETIRRKVTSSATSKSSLVNTGQPAGSLPKLVMKKL